MSHITVKMGDRGRVVIPSSVRRRLGLAPGDALVLSEHGDEIRLQPLARRVAALRGAYADLAPGRDLAAELIAERRAEAARE